LTESSDWFSIRLNPPKFAKKRKTNRFHSFHIKQRKHFQKNRKQKTENRKQKTENRKQKNRKTEKQKNRKTNPPFSLSLCPLSPLS
jgi:hypothetical protein